MTEILEKGTVSFHYWPARGEADAEGPRDAQRFFLVLKPDDGEARYRRLIVGQKKLPEPGGDGNEQRYWGFVDRVARDEDEALSRPGGDLDGPPAKRAAEGAYVIARHDDHTDLAYHLHGDAAPDARAERFHVATEAAYVLSIKNPRVGSPPGAGLDDDDKVAFPRALQERFGDNRWTDADPPAFLDHEGAEFLLVAGHEAAPADEREALGRATE